MTRHALPVLHALLFASALLPASAATHAQPQRAAEELGLSGYVLAPDGTPVSGGSVAIPLGGVRGSIDRTGRFRLVPGSPGVHQLTVSVAGLAPYRVNVTVPPSRTLRLPVIRLSPATYFRARFVSSAGEPLTSPRLRRQSVDANGRRLADPPGDRVAEQIDGDGTITIGPLPRGVTMLALDTPPLALTRLPDLYVTGADALLDGGTVIVQPGTVLDVDLVDATGAPVPAHEVFLEDALPLSPVGFVPVRTNPQGRATFSRLSAGNYRVRTATGKLCAYRDLSIERVVSVSGSGTVHIRLIIDGDATFRITSPLGPLWGTMVSAAPDVTPPASPGLPRNRFDFSPLVARPSGGFRQGPSCVGGTDGDGRVTLAHFPPGPARVAVQLPYSTYVRRVNVPAGGGELAIVIPDGFLPLRVTSARQNEPVTGAVVTWTGGGGRVEATSSVNGETLLEGVGTGGGTLAIAARGYQRVEEALPEPPALLHEVVLAPEAAAGLRAKVITASGEPLPGAVVELSSGNPIEIGRVAMTDATGFVAFPDAPAGALHLTAAADGFVITAMRVAEDSRTGLVLTLPRGYRAIASVELPAAASPHLVRVVNEAGVSMDGLLDPASDRSIEPPGRLSLGPLAPGTYLVELHGPREHRQERIRIVDRDVSATFR